MRVALRRQEAPSLPEPGSIIIDRVDHEGAAANQAGSINAAFEGMFDQARADPLPCPSKVSRKLAEEQAGNRIGWLAGPDRSRQDRGHDGGRSQAIVSDNPPRLMHDEYGGKALLLIGQCARLQPVIERWLATGKLRDVMRSRERFRSR